MANLEGEEFKKLKPFFVLSKDFEFDPVICFYLKQFAITKGLEIFKKMKNEGREDDAIKQTINNWIIELETYKKCNAHLFEDKEKNINHLEETTNIFFEKADEELRTEAYDKNTLLGFQSCAKFFEILDHLGRGSEEYLKKRKYSLAKAVEISKRLKNPELYQKNQLSKDAIDEEKTEPKANVPFASNFSTKKPLDSLLKYQNKPCQDSISRLLEFIETDPQFLVQINEIKRNQETSELEQKRIEEKNYLNRLPQKNNDFEMKKKEEENALPINNNDVPPTKSIRQPQDSRIRIAQSNLREKIRKECDSGVANLQLNKIGTAKSDLEKALKLIEEYRKL